MMTDKLIDVNEKYILIDWEKNHIPEKLRKKVMKIIIKKEKNNERKDSDRRFTSNR